MCILLVYSFINYENAGPKNKKKNPLLIFINQAKAHVAVGDYRVAVTTNIKVNSMARRLDGNISNSVGRSRENWRVSVCEALPSVAQYSVVETR